MEIAITTVKLRLEDQGRYRRERLIGNNMTRKERMSPNRSEHLMIQYSSPGADEVLKTLMTMTRVDGGS
jgi:hypothetical protein